jgi:drug/metabolite transporter (DMT)-like permease
MRNGEAVDFSEVVKMTLIPARYPHRMRPTMAQLRAAAAIAAIGLTAFIAMRLADHLIGHDRPFTPGIVSAVFIGLVIFLLRRYGPRGPVDPRRQRIWFLSALAASGVVTACGLIASVWIAGMHP